jgi:transposase
MAKPAPEVIRLSPAQLEGLVAELRAHLPAAVFELVHTALQTLQWVLEAMELKTTTIARLKRVLFGSRSEKTATLFPPPPATAPGTAEASPESAPPAQKPKRRGHGRQGAGRYTGARMIGVPHPHLRAGDRCPHCAGTLAAKTPARVVCIHAQPMFTATLYEVQVLRCNRCQKLFTAPLPPEAQRAKYDPGVGDLLALLRYGAGVPMYRTAKWQQDLGVPLPASTQWELMAQAAQPREGIYEAMIAAAAQAKTFHTDDTTMRVQSLRRDLAAAGLEAQRTGIFTTSLIADLGGPQVALYFTGSQHAGENLDRVLQHRHAGLEQPLHMCDGLARNESKEFETILCNCLTHGRRQFTDVREGFPEECRQVIESLREVYRFDAQAREQQLAPDQRLRFHQEHSRPILDQLHQWMSDQIEQKRVEPNSGLGQAIAYMRKRWDPLTRFLTIPGAPLDNNICERALKLAILHRKNSLSYKTLHGARVGDFFMSVIHTCRLNALNPIEYLAALREHADQMLQNPSQWLPWNYRQTLQALDTS